MIKIDLIGTFWLYYLCVIFFTGTEVLATGKTVLSTEQPAWVQGIGFVEPDTEIRRLSFKHPGVIARCRHEIGQRVKAGDVLMEQDNAEEKATVELAKSILAVAKSELRRILAGINPDKIRARVQALLASGADVEYAKSHLARIGRLTNARVASIEEHELAVTDLKRKSALQQRLMAETEYLRHYIREEDRIVGEARVSKAEKELAIAEQRLEQTILHAPLDGTILEILHREGEATHLMGNADPVILLGQMDHLRIRAEFNENYVLKIKAKQKAVIFGRALGGREIHGTVVLVKPVMGKKIVFAKSAAERKDIDVIQVFIQPNEKFELPLGMRVDVKIYIGS